jgi:DNA transposition AAA+ family ATPase
MIQTEVKNRILEELTEQRKNFGGSDAQYARSMGINPAQFSRIQKGDTERVISDANWISIARRLGVELREVPKWNVAETPVFQYINTQLKWCQENSRSGMLCDCSDIGKTFTAKYYAKANKHVAYIDCSQVKKKTQLIKQISQEFGLSQSGRYSDMYENLVFYVKSLINPLIILDEAGDLSYEAFLEIKALWNATEYCCGFYMMGADGLKAKIERSINCQKVGYVEIFTRFGDKFQKCMPVGGDDRKQIALAQAILIAQANSKLDKSQTQALVRRAIGESGLPSLRRVYIEIRKLDLGENNHSPVQKEVINSQI